MKMDMKGRGRCLGAGAWILALVALCIPHLAGAGVCFTSGKVYVQQKVWDKACWQLECARREEPENPQVYALLGVARYEQKQYASAGAVFQTGLAVAAKKKDKKRQDEMTSNRGSMTARLFNLGIAALNRAGKITEDDSRTSDAGTPQAALAKERGEPKDYSRFTEGGKIHEIWYYPEQGVAYHFTPGSTEPLQIPYKPFRGPTEASVAITDTTVYPAYSGASAVAEAAYDFELAMLVDPSSSDIYKNLSYAYGVLGRPDDAIRAAQVGLSLKPDDKQLMQNLRVAAMGRGNRLFADKKYIDAIPAYRAAMAFDSAGTIMYLSRIAESYQLEAQPMQKGAQRDSLFENAVATYLQVVEKTPADSAGNWAKENSLYNAAVIEMTLEKYPRAVEILDKSVAMFPKSKELLSLAGQAKYQTNPPDYNGSVAAMRKVLELDPKDKDAHQFLFLALNKLNKRDESVAEYTVYKALSDGKQRLGNQVKIWVDSAGNRLPPGHQVTKTVKADGYPDEVRTFSDGDKTLESWFYWTKGKSITFLEGQVFSQATFPPVKK
jgi:tetratricopeptide (TPR) repeat protein